MNEKSGDILLAKLAIRKAVENSVEILQPMYPVSDVTQGKLAPVLRDANIQTALMDTREVDESFWIYELVRQDRLPTFWRGYS